MKKDIKKSGRKIIRKLSRASHKASQKSKDHIKTHFFARIVNVKNVRLWVFEWLLLVIAITLFAVVQQIWNSNAYESKVFVAGGNYTEATLGQVNSMNPLYASTNSEKALSRLLFASLLSVDASGRLGNNLASSVSSDDTAKIWTVNLRPGLKWSDGATLSAADVEFTFNTIKNPSAKTVFSADFSKISVKQIDDLTLEFSLPSSYPAFNTFLIFPIIPKHILGDIEPALIYEHNFSKKPVGSGPFTLNASQNTNQGRTIYLSRNTNYYLGDTMLDAFTLRTYENTDEIVDAINRATVNGTADLRNVAEPNVQNSKFYKKESTISSGVFAFLNTADTSILSSTKLRQAIQSGLNMSSLRAGLVEEYPLSLPILEQQISLNFPKMPEYDQEKSLELLLAAGYSQKDGKLLDKSGAQANLTLAVPATGYLPELAERIKAQLEEFGFTVDLLSYGSEISSKEFFSTIVQPRAYDILLYEVDLGLDADPFAYYHSSQANSTGLNLSNYRNTLVDDLLLSARTTTSEKLRAAKYESFLKYWVNDVPAIAIHQSYSSYYFNRNMRIFSENNTLSTSLDRFMDVSYWASEKNFKNRTP